MSILLLTSIFWVFSPQCTPREDSISFPTLPEINIPETKSISVSELSQAPVKMINIALVGEVRGEIEPCGCPTLPYGGFARRSEALKNIGSEPGPLFHLDAGELLLKGFFSNKDQFSVVQRAKLLGELSMDVGVDAWAVGPSDLMAVGLSELQSMDAPPRISATWLEDGQYVFDPFLVSNKEDVSIAIIGLSAKPTDPNWQVFEFLSAKEAIERILPSIPSVDLIVALGSMDDEEISYLQQIFPTIGLFLTTEGSGYEDPNTSRNGTPIIEATKQGRFIQHIRIRHNTDKQTWLESGLSNTDWRNWLIARNDQNHPLSKSMREIGNDKILYHSELIPLSASFDSNNASKERIAQFSKSRLELSQKQAEQPTTVVDPGYAASGRCSQCHTKEIAKWSFTNHSRAWESLINHPVPESTKNPECIACHSTGVGKTGGFGQPTTSNMRKVKAGQCEACHGPMRGHPQDENIHSIPVEEGTCLTCHDSANSPEFEFTKYLQMSTCQSK